MFINQVILRNLTFSSLFFHFLTYLSTKSNPQINISNKLSNYIHFKIIFIYSILLENHAYLKCI